MKISLSWLKDFVDIPVSAEETSKILTDIGLEVEKTYEVETVRGGLAGLLIGEVLTCEKHPDADRLKITTVNIGNDEPSQIVCGAPNVEKGQKVVVATPGCVLYPSEGDSFKIKKSKIRGVESLGMICAEDEIGLGKSHSGIMVLPEDAPVGEHASKYFNVENDIVFEIGLTPNRADAMSHFGVARDLMVAFKHLGIHPKTAKVCSPNVSEFKPGTNSKVTLKVETDACGKYLGISIENLKVAESPDWMKRRLNSIGITPKNNLVDITNYVMHELGQPLHAFDADIVKGEVVVRSAKEGEKFITLDEVERTLNEKDMMICNATEPMCIAGVFGGEKSGVSEETVNIFLESAYFNPVRVRKSAKRHGLNTDASFRFERGVDPEFTEYALKRAAMLFVELGGGEITSEIVAHDELEIAPFTVKCNYDKINALIGHELSKETVNSILNDLEISVEENSDNNFTCTVPSYRVDVQREADIVEEVLRIYGFNNIPIPQKLNSSISYRPAIDAEKIKETITQLLLGNGLVEGMSNSLTKGAYHTNFEDGNINSKFNVAMLNPLSKDLDVLRQTLLFGCLEAVALNQNHGNPDIQLFEFGKSYHKYESGYQEQQWLGICLSGLQSPSDWQFKKNEYSYYHAKSLLEGILNRLGINKNVKLTNIDSDHFVDGQAYQIAKKKIAKVGWISKKLRKAFDIKKDVFFIEINWDGVLELSNMNRVKFKELVKFPAVNRDFSLLIGEEVSFNEIKELAEKADRKILKQVELFDVYEGDNLPKGKKSYAVRFILQDENKTLKDKEIDSVMNKIQDSLIQNLSAELR